MSQSRAPSFASQDLVFEEDRLETYTAKELTAVCQKLKVQVRGHNKKEELQKVLWAWVAAGTASGQFVDPMGESVDPNPGEDVLRVQEMLGGEIPSGSDRSGGSKSLTPEELEDRGNARRYQIELEGLKMEEKKILLEHELKVKELDVRTPGVSGETPAPTSGALSSPWALERKAGGIQGNRLRTDAAAESGNAACTRRRDALRRPDVAAAPLKSATPWKSPHHVVTDAA
ncbi:hypothetical protein NDU88_011173 [Pleurodeles waltl]|uniref:SAP domain-containing protein n=1 Tax=Pleurodeles waltl TaxID=8319 RepID=A0AAV7S454_PLEWA|nr:hypothetical protein NDU88_011173 [Pleurodeles waltl]